MKTTLLRAIVAFAIAVSMFGCEDDAGIREISTGTLNITGAYLFPKTAPGTARTRTVSIKNIGDEPVTLIEFSQKADADFTGAWSIVGTDGKVVDGGDEGMPPTVHIEPAETLRLAVTFRPSVARIPAGSVHFRTNSGIQAQRRISLPISGAKAVGELHASTQQVVFGRAAVGDALKKTVVLTNLGTDAIRLEDLVINGSQTFSVLIRNQNPLQTPAVLRDPDGDQQMGIAPGGQAELTVVFTPSADRTADGELVVLSDAHNPKLVIGLLGNAAAPCVRVVPRDLAFPDTAVGAKRLQPIRIESCGGQPITVKSAKLSADATGFGFGAQIALPQTLPGTTEFDPVPPGIDAVLTFEPTAVETYAGQLIIESTSPDTPELIIPLSGRGVHNDCPTPRVPSDVVQVRPLDVVTLDGSASTDPDGPNGRPVEYTWTVVARPAGSTSQPVERLHDDFTPAEGGPADRPSTPRAKFFVDLAGEYVLQLHVADHYGAEAPSTLCPAAPALIHIKAVPEEKLHIQLTWDTPEDADQTDDLGTDVDLHLRHPSSSSWFAQDGTDCYYSNPTPDWGRPGDTNDDPSLDIDDVNGAGPENINIARPESSQSADRGYRVGVHYFAAEGPTVGDDYRPLKSTATVRIFVDGQMAYEGSKLLRDTNDFWTVADVKFTGNGGRVVPVDAVQRVDPQRP